MNKIIKLSFFSITLKAAAINCYSSTSEEEFMDDSRSSVVTAHNADLSFISFPQRALRRSVYGAAFLVSQLPIAVGREAGFNDVADPTNSTCICPPASSGATPADFYINNIGTIATTVALSVILAPKMNEWVINPASKYMWNRFCQTTIDDIPVGPELTDLNGVEKVWRKIYEKATPYLYRSKLREQTEVKFAELKIIDEVLTSKPYWKREEIKINGKFVGFTYTSSACKITIENPLRTQDLSLEPVESNMQLPTWQVFVQTIIKQGANSKINAIPGKVNEAIGRICVNKFVDQEPINMLKSESGSIAFFSFAGNLILRIEKSDPILNVTQ